MLRGRSRPISPQRRGGRREFLFSALSAALRCIIVCCFAGIGNARVTNNSGEDYENAQVRLVVGVIRLVEEIRQLAQIFHANREDRDEERSGLKRDKDKLLKAELALDDGIGAGDVRSLGAGPA